MSKFSQLELFFIFSKLKILHTPVEFMRKFSQLELFFIFSKLKILHTPQLYHRSVYIYRNYA